MTISALTDHFATLAPAYDAVLSDVWGVIHNGVTTFPQASDALARFRSRGGRVVLISNAPRPGDSVTRMLDRLGVPRAVYDGIVTSGMARDRWAGAREKRCSTSARIAIRRSSWDLMRRSVRSRRRAT